jgi:hypothetical protein
VLDGVCAVASEEIRFDDWGIDVVISATQKLVKVETLVIRSMLNPALFLGVLVYLLDLAS